jgi:hypothetical protein
VGHHGPGNVQYGLTGVDMTGMLVLDQVTDMHLAPPAVLFSQPGQGWREYMTKFNFREGICSCHTST